MNKTESKLFTEMAIFFFIIVLCFGLLIIKEKSNSIKIEKVDKKINEYINTNYKDLKDEFVINKIEYKNNSYYKKILNNKNKNLNFIITYKNNKISSTYNEDYLEGRSLFSFLEKKMTKKLNSINNDNNYKNLKINYNLTIEEERELLITLEEIRCNDCEKWFDNVTNENRAKLFWAVVYIRSLMMTLNKSKIEENFSDLFPIKPDDEINIWVKENKSLIKQCK